MHFMMYVQCIMYIFYLCFPVGHKKPSVGSDNKYDKHFYYGDFYCINILSDF